MRYTSLKCYGEIKESLSKVRFDVWKALVEYGPGTASEISRRATNDGHFIAKGFWKRLPELRDSGVATEEVERACGVTGRLCIVWKAMDRSPVKLKKQPKLTPGQEIQILKVKILGLQDQLKKANEKIEALTKSGQIPLI